VAACNDSKGSAFVTRNRHEAEEIGQDAFLAMWARCDRMVFSVEDRRAYLHRSAMNLFRTLVRRVTAPDSRRDDLDQTLRGGITCRARLADQPVAPGRSNDVPQGNQDRRGDHGVVHERQHGVRHAQRGIADTRTAWVGVLHRCLKNRHLYEEDVAWPSALEAVA
jgi:DNA-directed RNA polymerase specialized sigma24 family protein